MELRLLGPPELVHGGRSLDLGGPRKRVVLCALALNANRVTPVEQLLDAAWGESPPGTPRVQIQIAVSALRKVLAEAGKPDAIRTQPAGYLLELAPGELDVEQFKTLRASAREHASAGRLAEAATDLRTALALWRGPALAGIQSEMVQREATLLADHRRAAVEERIRLDLALGRHEEISGELASMVNAEPLRERLQCFLMLALYRSGRQAEALEAGRRAREILIEEIGVDPGQELRDLEHAILNRDPALDLPPGETSSSAGARVTRPVTPVVEPIVIPRQLPASIAEFTGRETHLTEIRGVLRRDGEPGTTYAMRIMTISGPGGVGKSALAVRAAHELSDEYPDGQFYADIRALPADGAFRLLGRFLRALGLSGTAVPDDPDERTEMYRTMLANRRVLIVLDDVADEEQVLPLLPGSPDCAVIITSRTRLSGLPGAHRIAVDVFDSDQSMNLLTRIVGVDRVEREPEACAELVHLCDGLPLALRIAGARLASRPHWRVEDLVRRLSDETRRLDEFVHRGLEVRSNIALTYRNLLSGAGQRLFRLFATIRAPEFPGWAAAALLDTSLSEAEDELDNLVDARVLEAVRYPSERMVRYRFHELVRVYAQEQLIETDSVEEREAALGRYLGGWMALAEEAHRRALGGHYSVLHGTAPRWTPPDAPLPDRIGDPVQWWEREHRNLVPAIRQAAIAGLDELCWDLALTSVTLFETKGYFDDWQETALLARDVTEAAGNRRGAAAAHYSLGSLHLAQRRLVEAESFLTTALKEFTALSDTHGCALALRNGALVSRLRGDPTAMRRYYAALTKMHQAGDRIGEAHVLSSLAKIRIDAQYPAAALGMLTDALEICLETGSLKTEAQVRHRMAELYVSRDDLEAARQSLHRTLRLVRDLGDRTGEAYALHLLGVVRHREGRLDHAHTTLVQALTLARQVGDRWIEAQCLYELGAIAIDRGVPAAGAEHLSEARELFETLDSTLWHGKTLIMLSEVHLTVGETSLAAEEVEHATAVLSLVDSPEAVRLLSQLARGRANQARRRLAST